MQPGGAKRLPEKTDELFMVSESAELNVITARALMSLIKITEALEDDGCIVSAEGSVAAQLLPEMLAAAFARAKESGCGDAAVGKTLSALMDIRDSKVADKFEKSVIMRAERMAEGEAAGCRGVLEEFDRQILEKNKDFYRIRGGADICLTDMYEETVDALFKIMLEG